MEVTFVELSQCNRDTTEVDPSIVNSCMAVKDTNVEDLSQVTITSHTVTPAEKESNEDKPKREGGKKEGRTDYLNSMKN